MGMRRRQINVLVCKSFAMKPFLLISGEIQTTLAMACCWVMLQNLSPSKATTVILCVSSSGVLYWGKDFPLPSRSEVVALCRQVPHPTQNFNNMPLPTPLPDLDLCFLSKMAATPHLYYQLLEVGFISCTIKLGGISYQDSKSGISTPDYSSGHGPETLAPLLSPFYLSASIPHYTQFPSIKAWGIEQSLGLSRQPLTLTLNELGFLTLSSVNHHRFNFIPLKTLFPCGQACLGYQIRQ